MSKYNTMDDEQLLEYVTHELQGLTYTALQPALLALQPAQAYMLIGVLQLACCHPHLPDLTRKLAHEIVDQLTGCFNPTGAIAESIHRGWREEQQEG